MNLETIAKLEDLIVEGENLTNFSSFKLTLDSETPDENGVYTFSKTIDVPFTSWHYDEHQISVEVKSTNTNNNQSDEKTREDYDTIEGSNMNGLFRAKEQDAPTFTTPSFNDGYYSHNIVEEIEIVAHDNKEKDWYKNSGIQKLTLAIYKNDNELENLFNSDFLSEPSIEETIYSWVYRPTEGFGEGKWKLILTITDNDDNSTTIEKIFTVDLYNPSLSVNTIPSILDTKDIEIEGTTEPGIDVKVIVQQSEFGSTTEKTGISDENGKFNILVTLFEGTNNITIVATEPSGRYTSSTMETKVDTSTPQIISVTTTPITTTVGAGKLTITVRVMA